ncbi:MULTISPECIES: M20 aminoacylase family protein [unclassified Limnobacter]|mgnify:FL=1|uniref:M20 aminoacylase family protein n=1 Tax=unclassified Limnobacter TaxID=2630203 RepID=UPI000C405655|nr:MULTISPECIES: M20 aminoacylase family protein [unclassified Limnobacter]MAZ09965.1 amidohydrolase [Sutterellaceae bacterium]
MNPSKIESWVNTRRDIHAHPELRYEENRTADIVAKRLVELGYAVETGIGRTGVVGLIQGTQGPGKMIGLRADMDALPIQERNQFPHASRHPGKMHACGHDGHVAMLLGAAQEIAENRNFKGSVALIFQPAEEGGAGAQRMIDDGLFQRYPVDAVFAMHNWPGLQEGEFAAHVGAVMASSNEFSVKIQAKGAHAAMPDLGIDPVVIAAQLILAFQTIVSRSCKPVEPAVLSVTQIQAGEAINVIPDHAVLQGTVRTFSIETLDLIEQHMRKLSTELCAAFGATAEMEFERKYPPTINSADMAELAKNALQQIPEVMAVHTNLPPTMGAEDFAFMLQHKPGAYLWIGNGDGGHRTHGHGIGPCTLHNPSYDFNDKILPLGVTAWLAITQAFLENT